LRARIRKRRRHREREARRFDGGTGAVFAHHVRQAGPVVLVVDGANREVIALVRLEAADLHLLVLPAVPGCGKSGAGVACQKLSIVIGELE
jgi:hypothetical protein